MIHRINSVAPDLDDRVIKPNQARSANNMRFGASDDDSNLSGGIMVNGNYRAIFNDNINPYKANNIPTEDSDPRVIGTLIDYENNSIYVAICRKAPLQNPNLGARHQIVKINTNSNTAQNIIVSEFLNFAPYLHVSMAVIDGLLYWTDDANEPRMINIAKGIRTYTLNQSWPNAYPTLTSQNLWTIAQIKRNPQVELTVEYKETALPPLGYTILPPYSQGWGSPSTSAQYAYYWFTQDSTGGYRDKNWIKNIPYQFSYYYIYDNNEDSRLAPWSAEIYSSKKIGLVINSDEIGNYIYQSIVKKVVIVMREGNEGVPYNIFEYDTSAFPPPVIVNGIPQYQDPGIFISDIDGINKTPTPASVYSQRYDSIPLRSKTNTIANNILNHANFLLDYSNYGTIKIASATPQQKNYFNFTNNQNLNISGYQTYENFQNHKTFRPSSTYSIGLQLIDEYGRCSPVLSVVDVTIPEARVYQIVLYNNYGGGEANFADPGNPGALLPRLFDYDARLNCYNIKITLSGQLPSWAKSVKFAMTKNNTVSSFNKTVARLYFWYSNSTGNIFVRTPFSCYTTRVGRYSNAVIENERQNVYSWKGYGIELTDDTPFIYNAAEEQYIKIARQYMGPDDYYYTLNDDLNIPTSDFYIEYKIVGQVGRVLLVNETKLHNKFVSAYHTSPQGYDTMIPFFYEIEIYTKKKQKEIIYYDVESFPILGTNLLEYIVEGDCYITYFNKSIKAQSFKNYYNFEEFYWTDSELKATIVKPNDNSKVSYNYPDGFTDKVDGGYNITGYFYSMNITNINSEDWNPNYGLENIIYTGLELKTNQFNNICFSDIYKKGTLTNGLNRFNPLNVREASAENGGITSLVTTSSQQGEPGVLLAIGEFGVTSFYYNAIQLTNADGTSNLATTDEHLASQRPLIGQFGTTQAQSITKTTFGAVYWWSDLVNDFIRYSRAGLERLGLTYSFNNRLRIDVGSSQVVTGYDFVMDEAILVPDKMKSFVFSERYKTFQGFREYYSGGFATPEAIVGMPSKTYFFLNGIAYISDTGAIKNTFFGTKYNPSVEIVTNEYPTQIKQWNSVKIYGPKPLITSLRVGSAEGYSRVSYIQYNWWIQRKGEWDAAIRRADTPSSSPLEGKIMESRILYSTFVFDANDFDKLNFIEIKHNLAVTQ